MVSIPEAPKSRCSKVPPVRLTSASKNCSMYPCLAARKAFKIRSRPRGQAERSFFGLEHPLPAPNATSSCSISKIDENSGWWVGSYSLLARRVRTTDTQPDNESDQKIVVKRPHLVTRMITRTCRQRCGVPMVVARHLSRCVGKAVVVRENAAL